MSVYISTVEAAKRLSVSDRRVRFLLSAGRLKGQKDCGGRWQVELPFTVQMGSRGPALFTGMERKKPEPFAAG